MAALAVYIFAIATRIHGIVGVYDRIVPVPVNMDLFTLFVLNISGMIWPMADFSVTAFNRLAMFVIKAL